MSRRSKICFITPGHISSNPRLVKEVSAASEAGYVVSVLYSQYLESLVLFDKEIVNRYPSVRWRAIDWTGGSISGKITRWLSAIVYKCHVRCFTYFPVLHFAKRVANRHYRRQLGMAVAQRADLYVAHNLGALAVAADAALRLKSKFAFDAEDFHRHELDDRTDTAHYKVTKIIEDHYIPIAGYLSAASPQIGDAYRGLYPTHAPVVINNVFSIRSLKTLRQRGQSLKLFWFSQTVGPGRGLEDVISAMARLKDLPITLTLLGSSTAYLSYFRQLLADVGIDEDKVAFHPTVSEEEIFEIANQHDVGLALEQRTPLNRNICLTNKIFTYLLSGLAIIASDTEAQGAFLRRHPEIGFTYPSGNVDELARVLKLYAEDTSRLQSAKGASLALAKTTYHWENEKLTFVKTLEKVLV